MTQAQNVIAIVYDYDRTLSPQSMHQDVIFPQIGVDADAFWEESDKLRNERAYEDELAWIRLLLENPAFRQLSNTDLQEFGRRLKFFPGVPQIFDRLGSFLKEERYVRHGVILEHYIVTSGLKAILSGSALSEHVEAIFGCELDEDGAGRVFWPKRVVSHTSKTQYLFRITKGPEYVDLSHDVNDHMPEGERRIPFRNMIYIGDGPTDVPCFAVLTHRGGVALAVYNPEIGKSFETCMRLQEAKRVDGIAPADYRKGTHLRLTMEHHIRRMAERIVGDQEETHRRSVIEAVKPY
jgi:hypothetical protein